MNLGRPKIDVDPNTPSPWLHAALLDWWLHVATKDLATGTRARIRSEIETHYAESVHSHLAEGMSEPDAQAAAFAELGEPTIAAKHFRKHHLTAVEETKLQKSEEVAAKSFTIGDALLLIICAGAVVWPSFNSLFLWFSLVILVRQFGPRFLFRALPAHLLTQWLLSFVIVADIAFGVAYCFISHRNEGVFTLFFYLVLAIFTFPELRLWLKLRKAGDLGQVPPHGIAPS